MPEPDAAALALAPFVRRGHRRYGEDVSQTHHALQTARIVARSGAPDSLVAAALLHDVGHLLDHPDGPPDDRTPLEGHHERGAAFLARWFGPDVTEPVRLHVAAKRWLCATDDAHLASLSSASRRSLAAQGGPMSAPERATFERSPHHRAAVVLRRADDEAKDPDAAVGTLDDHRALLVRLSGRAGARTPAHP